jgi:hypothetical protein
LAVTRAMVPRPGIGGTGGHHRKRTLPGRPAERASQRPVIPPQQGAAPVMPSPAACPSLQAAPVTAAVPRPEPLARRSRLVPARCRSAPSHSRTFNPSPRFARNTTVAPECGSIFRSVCTGCARTAPRTVP